MRVRFPPVRPRKTMKIFGPYLRKDGRKHICIVYSSGLRKTKSYPRWLLEQHLGRELLPDETVDHIDNDFTNDSLDNLQILSRADNTRKGRQNNSRKMQYVEFECPICKQQAVKSLRDVKGNIKKGKAGPFCSRKCAGIFSHTI